MRQQLGYEQLPALAIAEGASSPDPGGPGTVVYSTSLDRPVVWTGAAWVSLRGGAALGQIAGLSPSNDDVLQRKAGVWTNRTPGQLKADLALAKGDVGLGNVDNTSDANKPVSTAQQTALDAKAPLASPALTGNPTAPTQTAGNNSTRLANTAFVSTAISNAVPVLASGTFTPTLSNQSGCSTTAQVCRYIRIGDQVVVSGAVTVDPNAASIAYAFEATLPIARSAGNFSSSFSAAGSGSRRADSSNNDSVRILSQFGVQRVRFECALCSDTEEENLAFTYAYSLA